MKSKFILLLVAISTLFATSCGDKTETITPNLIAGEWFLHAPEQVEVDPDAPQPTPDVPVKDLFTYAPLTLDWKTDKTFAAMGDENTQWSGFEASVLATTIAGPMIMEEFTAVQFKDNGAITATVIGVDGLPSVVEQNYATYKIESESKLLVFVNLDAILTRVGMHDIMPLITILTPYLENGFPINYKIVNGVVTFSVNKEFILPIVKTIVPIVASLEVPALKPDYSNMMEVMMIQTVKAALAEEVVNSTTMFDVLMSLKNTAPAIEK